MQAECCRSTKKTSEDFKCSVQSCDYEGSSAEALRKHKQRSHVIQPKIATYHCQLRCAYCEARLETQLAYIAHVQKHHNSNHTIERKILESEEEFQRWVASLKKRYGVDFVKRRGDKKTAAGRTVRMFCSRSGSNVKGSKLTQSGIIPKMSVRCGKDCTAFLIAHFTESNVSVEYCLEHAGHIIDAEDGKWMRLSRRGTVGASVGPEAVGERRGDDEGGEEGEETEGGHAG
ncbi:hypothetical protein QR680_006126 [Steinernema hermaphroditum]|uniref:C2H2-type domain-containing protein n=1 Tax=Steinernema hermaphroditum TaxID=289476 RepID=A0AA39LWL2_9BILA|nr:hypothetical protein QR680_006126 [Steinernema hermaphroditum]